MIKNYEYQSEFARKYYGNGHAQGQRSAILAVARARFETVSAEDEERLNAMTDTGELERLVVEVAMVPSYEAFQIQLSARSKS